MAHPDLEYALGDAVMDDITTTDGARLRDVKGLLENVENQLSYVRRIAQSRIDIARSELSQRTAGRQRSELADVIRRLPEVLSEQTPHTGLPRFAAPEIDPEPEYAVELDEIVPPTMILDIGVLTRSELREVIVRLESVEARTSVQRRIVQERIDQLHHAIASDVHTSF